jgi:hypothetical protein
VRLCVVVMQQQVLLSPKFGSKCSHIFTQSPYSITVMCGMSVRPACQDEFFENNPLDVKENDDHALDFTFHLYHLFSLCEFGLSVYGSCFLPPFPCMVHAFLPEHLSNHCQGLRRTSSQICTKFDAIPLSDPS